MPTIPTVYGEMVQVTNDAGTTFKDSFASKVYKIEPGGIAIVPLDAVYLWCGNGELRDNIEKSLLRRTEEYTRLRARYGAYNIDEEFEANRPRLSVARFDGRVVVTILDDPEGDSLRESASVDEFAMLKENYERQQAELDAMRKIITAREGAQQATKDIEEDKPRRVPVGNQRGKSG